MTGQFRTTLADFIFKLFVVTYAGLWLLESLKEGFVSDVINHFWILAAIIISGAAAAMAHDEEEKISVRGHYMFLGLLGILLAGIVLARTLSLGALPALLWTFIVITAYGTSFTLLIKLEQRS
ncbi:MAG: hypothetical protein Q8Q20_00330 [bacterium]|nr:hypothetical protein [bacterium]